MGRRLSKDLPLQILSVLLAVALWVQATAVQNPVERFTFDGIPVTYTGLPKGLVVSEPIHPTKVNITVRCRRRVGEKLSAGDFSAKVALDTGRAGSYDYPVEVTGPPGARVEVIEISPASATVSLERAASVKVPVEARVTGSPADGYALGAVAADPAEITVRGPASAVNRVVKVVAELDINSATADRSGEASLTAVDASGSPVAGLSFSPQDVTVSAAIIALPPAESVDVDVALTGTPAPGYAVLKITADPARVEVRPVPGRTIDFTHILTQPVNIDGATSDVLATVGIVLPPGVASASPEQVDVVVEIGASRSFPGVAVQVRNVGAGLRAAVDPAAVDVVVRGPKALLDRLTPADVGAWVDAGGRGTGDYTVMVEVTLPDWTQGEVEVSSVNPSEVTLDVGR